MSLERIRRQYDLITKPAMTLNQVKQDEAGKRYIFLINGRGIFYSISAEAFWAGANPAAPEPTPAPARKQARPQLRVPKGQRPPENVTLIRADELRAGDVIARKASPAGYMTVHQVEPAKVHGKTRLTYTNTLGRRTSDAFSGEKFVLHQRRP